MLRPAVALAILPFFSAASAQTTTVASTDNEGVPPAVQAIVQTDAFAAGKPSELCSIYGGSTLKAGRPVVVVGERECKSKYGTGSAQHYEVLVSGKRLFVDKSSIKVTEADQVRLKVLSQESREEYFERAAVTSLEIRRRELSQLVEAIKRTQKVGLTVIHASIEDVSEHTEGTSFAISVINPTDRTIKYIWFTVVGYNAVNDPVRDRLKGGPPLTVKAIGPIEKEESGRYKWEYMWHTDIVESFKITEIKVQYMDGSLRTIRDWKAITLSPENRRVLEEEE